MRNGARNPVAGGKMSNNSRLSGIHEWFLLTGAAVVLARGAFRAEVGEKTCNGRILPLFCLIIVEMWLGACFLAVRDVFPAWPKRGVRNTGTLTDLDRVKT